MVQITGEYKFVKSEGDEDFISTFTKDPEQIKKYGEHRPVLTIKQSGDEWTISESDGLRNSTSTFKLGVPADTDTPPHGVLKSVTTREGDKFISVVDLPNEGTVTRILNFTPTGINIEVSRSKSDAIVKRIYERV